MIDFLKGQLSHLEQDHIVIEVHGIGYRVFCSNPYVFSSKTEIQVFIHYHVREDAVLLYGFETREEQGLFRKLIDVSGIGPRVGLGILSGARPNQIISMIQSEDIIWLTKLPGIGKKTAQRMVLDLKDKLDGLMSTLSEADQALSRQDDQDSIGLRSQQENVWSEAKQGLVALGYHDSEADKALQQVRHKVTESDPLDTVIKLALQALYKG